MRVISTLSVERRGAGPAEVARVGIVGAALTHIIFVPGNPGVASYYTSTAEMLAERLGATAAVVGYLGHGSAPLEPPMAAYGLEAQCEHVHRFFEGEVAKLKAGAEDNGGEARLLVVGHSIGAYIAFAGAQRAGLRRGAIGGVPTRSIGLMPFLERTELVRTKAEAATSWWAPAAVLFLSCAAGLVGLLPRFATERLLKLAASDVRRFCPEMVSLTARALPRFGAVRNILTLFRDEARELAEPYDYAALKERCGGALALLYAEGDTDEWAPSEAAARAAAAGVAVAVEEGVPHAFSVEAPTREAVVARVLGLIEEMN